MMCNLLAIFDEMWQTINMPRVGYEIWILFCFFIIVQHL